MKIMGKKPIKADDEIEVVDEVVDEVVEEPVEEVAVESEAMGLLFEAEDVAELVAEITEQPVEVTVEDESVVFAIGDDEFTVTPEGDEEILEAVRKPFRGKRTVKADRRPMRRPIPRREKVAEAKEVKKDEKIEEACGKKKEVKASKTIKKFPKNTK